MEESFAAVIHVQQIRHLLVAQFSQVAHRELAIRPAGVTADKR
jgi:hypothetical protein